MPRPKGSRDKRKRKRKVILTGKQERELIKDYENGYTSSQVQEKYGITKSALSSLRKERLSWLRKVHAAKAHETRKRNTAAKPVV